MSILYGIPSPFDFKLVEKYQKEIIKSGEFDVIKMRYYPEITAYNIMRDYFLAKDYSHLIFGCSDIVVHLHHLNLLMEDIEQYPDKVLSGRMNLCLDLLDVYNITSNPVQPGIPEFMWYVDETLKNKPDVFPVVFSGFPLMCMPRETVRNFPFSGLRTYLKEERLSEGGLDTTLCWDLFQKNKVILCDKRIKLLHLKELQNESQPLLVGIKEPVTEFYQNGRKEIINTSLF